MISACTSTPGTAAATRRRDEVAQPDGAGADQHDAAGERVGVLAPTFAGSRSRGGGDARHAGQAGKVDAELAGGPGRHLEVADLQRRHGGLAGVGLAARAGRADHEASLRPARCAALRPTAPDRAFRGSRATSGTTPHDAVGRRRKAEEAEARPPLRSGPAGWRAPPLKCHAGRPAGRRRRRRSRPSAAAGRRPSRW